jgi:hypothetical protein
MLVNVPPFKFAENATNSDLGCMRIEVIDGLDAIDYITKTYIIYQKGE